ncbi:MAG TPA: hypothetical protein VJB06_03345, partial [archaeon]|nr:hypothetical protein [archaeon]
MPNIQVKAQRRDILARRVHEYAVSLFGQGIINRLTAAEQKDPRSFLPVPRDQHEFTTTVSIFARLLEKEGAELAGIKIFDKRVSIQIANMGFEYSGAEVHLCFSVPGGEGFFIRSFKGDSTGERKIKERSDHFEYVILSPADYPRLYGSVVFGRRSPFVDETYHPGSASGVTLEDIAEAARNSRTITKPIETHYGVIAYDSEKKEISFTDKRGKKCAYSGISRSFDVGQDADKVLLDNFHAAVQVSSKLLFFIPTNIILPFEHDFQVFYREFDKRKPSVAPDVVAPALEPPISVQTKFGKVVYDPSKGNVFLLDTGRKPLFRYSLRESKIYTTKGIVSRSDDIINLRQA